MRAFSFRHPGERTKTKKSSFDFLNRKDHSPRSPNQKKETRIPRPRSRSHDASEKKPKDPAEPNPKTSIKENPEHHNGTNPEK
jgi:hypothetical protein